MSKKKGKNKRISDKIKYLRDEGIPQNQAVGEAEGMERSGRLRAGGKYVRAKKRKSKRKVGRA
jgi:hypothetical protein